MAEQRDSHQCQIGLDDFRRCDWRKVLAGTARADYAEISQALFSAARCAAEEGREAEARIFGLLADACSMVLRPSSPNAPFQPMFVMAGKRSAIPEDLRREDLDFFVLILDEIDHPRLQARLADLVWLMKSPRDPKFALTAIDSYRKIPLNTESWARDGRACWERAVQLSLMLGNAARDRLRQIEETLLSALKRARAKDGFLALWLAELLLETGLGRSKAAEIASKLEQLAKQFDSDRELHQEREYYDCAAKWYTKADDDRKFAEMTVYLAESWVKEAVARISSGAPSHMVATMFLERAIHTYRRIPRKMRADFRVDERIQELHRLKREAGEKSLDEMATVTTPPVDITELVTEARKAVGGRQLLDALAIFASIYPGVRVDNLRASAIDGLRNHPLYALSSAMAFSKDGRVVAKRPSMSLSSGDDSENEATIWAEMARDYGLDIALAVNGRIWPALETLLLEHRLTERDLVALSAQSPIVPYGRERIVGKALFAGFERDFVTATHLLVPQVEHIVRWHLKLRGVTTTTLDANGIENEVGMSRLLDMSEVEDVFGKDLTFELKALFADPLGPNLRNEVAHGLLEYEAAQSYYTVYAWWFFFRLVFKTFLKEASVGSNSAEQGSEED